MSDELKQWEAFLDRAEIYDQTMIIGEKLEDYETLLRGLYDELTPRGIMEENQVFKLANAIWRRKRIDRWIQCMVFYKQVELQRKSQKKSALKRELKLLAPEFLKAKDVKEVEALLGKLKDPLGKKL